LGEPFRRGFTDEAMRFLLQILGRDLTGKTRGLQLLGEEAWPVMPHKLILSIPNREWWTGRTAKPLFCKETRGEPPIS